MQSKILSWPTRPFLVKPFATFPDSYCTIFLLLVLNVSSSQPQNLCLLFSPSENTLPPPKHPTQPPPHSLFHIAPVHPSVCSSTVTPTGLDSPPRFSSHKAFLLWNPYLNCLWFGHFLWCIYLCDSNNRTHIMWVLGSFPVIIFAEQIFIASPIGRKVILL